MPQRKEENEMDYRNYGNERWHISFGAYSGPEKTAVDMLYGLLQGYVPYVLTAAPVGGELPETVKNRILIGTLEDNSELQLLAEEGFFQPQTRPEGYTIKCAPDPKRPGGHLAIVQGADAAGVLYGAMDFERYAVRDEATYSGEPVRREYHPFQDAMPAFVKSSAPKIEYRGFWSWGHVIYDYKGYIDHMCACKLNLVILWNDFVPLNAAEVVAYAHEHAVKVVFGFSWCWGEKVDPSSPEDLKKWTNFVLDTYERQYRELGCDGIYFQAFTETNDTTIGGRSISELVIDWVGAISSQVYRRYPDLWIQFGLHATSIRRECGKFAAIDPRMSIVWEDAGGFPYDYDPAKLGNPQETYEYTEELLAIRGSKERFGAVFKGFTVLDWDAFEHQKGPFVLGKASSVFLQKRKAQKAYFWRYVAPYWITQADVLQQVLQIIANAPIQDRLVTALVEDGMWESGMHVSAQLLAELLWDPWGNVSEILTALLHDQRSVL